MTNPVDHILELFAVGGRAAYFGEPVSQAEHALQAAHLARSAGAAEDLLVAALLHDVGHLLHALPETVADEGIDARHEEGGAAWLARWFGPALTEPIRLHVAAKRYLCAVDPHYLSRLSPASIQSLALQGGPFDPAQVKQFEESPHAREAVALRRWDDEAKVPGKIVPDLEHYRALLESALARGEGAHGTGL
jgi:gamma-butyrobetaine dioxygenase